ncbi:MAG: hypothetical protein K8L99_16440 [Anaerolineae bacterium]|nr:hypothetical protein [Anaerolineae bacterium]
MRLLIGNQHQDFIPIKTFRARYDLADDFSLALFEPKDYNGLGHIDEAGSELNMVRQSVLEAIPNDLSLKGWIEFLPELSRLFQNKLDEINPQINLKSIEIEYAVSGFHDVCQSLIYAMIRAMAANEPLPSFEDVYQQWLDSSVKISNTVHHYAYTDELWPIQIVNNAYGRCGMIIWTNETTHYVYDNTVACPAEGFVQILLKDVSARILQAKAEPT